MWFRPANPAGEGHVPGSTPRQGVKEPPLGFVHTTAIPGVLHPYLPLCPHVVPLEMQTVLSASWTRSTPMVQGGLCVIYHNLGEENAPKYQTAVKTYKNVLGPMGHELDLGKMCGQEGEPAQAVLPLLYIVTKPSYFGPFVPATVSFHNQCQANFYPFRILFFHKGQM